MLGRMFPRQQPGKRIEARTINRPLDAIEEFDKLSVAAPLEVQHIAGTPMMRDATDRPVMTRLTGPWTTAGYPWRGGWMDGVGTYHDLPASVSDRAMADPAYEANGNTGLIDTRYVILRREPASGRLYFQAEPCA